MFTRLLQLMNLRRCDKLMPYFRAFPIIRAQMLSLVVKSNSIVAVKVASATASALIFAIRHLTPGSVPIHSYVFWNEKYNKLCVFYF